MTTNTSSSITRRIIKNIVDWTTELQHVARDFTQLGKRDQARVWNDLSGDEGRVSRELSLLFLVHFTVPLIASLQLRQFGIDGKEYFTQDIFEPECKVEEALNELSNEMNNIPSKEKQQYEKALGMSPGYVNSRNFRLKFLVAMDRRAREQWVASTLFLGLTMVVVWLALQL